MLRPQWFLSILMGPKCLRRELKPRKVSFNRYKTSGKDNEHISVNFFFKVSINIIDFFGYTLKTGTERLFT
jgi:hypothetical protein